MIDSHVHLRDEEWAYKYTIAQGLKTAEKCGLTIIIDMPNTKRPVTTRERVLERFALALEANSPVIYGTYIGLTSNPEQIKEAVEVCREFPYADGKKTFVAGIKAFWGKSVGDLSIVNASEQRASIAKLAELEYRGVLAGHHEKQSIINEEVFNPEKPWTWNDARPEVAETESIKDILSYAHKFNFKGCVYICHVSTPDSIKVIREYNQALTIRCEVTPNHLLFDTDFMKKSVNPLLYKVNPPIRSPETRYKLMDCFLMGQIDVLATDHAPHTLEEKTDKDKGYLSGISSLEKWPNLKKTLERCGASDILIDTMTDKNPKRIFGIK